MSESLHKNYFALDDGNLFVEGYTDNSTWNGWDKPIFTAENLKRVFYPYIPVFSFTDGDIPMATIDLESSIEVIESSPIWDEDKQIWLIGYAPEGFCFVRI